MDIRSLFVISLIFGLSAISPAQEQGVIIGWGSNDGFPQASGDIYNQAIPPGGNDFITVDAGLYHSIALKANGSLSTWGDDSYDQVSDTPAGTGYIDIAAGNYHSVAIKPNYSLVDWGDNYYGQLDGTPSGTNFIAIAAGDRHSLALRSDGSLVGWGSNDKGQTDVPAGNGFIAIGAGKLHSLAIQSAGADPTSGSLVAWGGNNDYGETTVPVGDDYVAVAGGVYHSLALRSDGSLVAWGVDSGLFDFGQVTDTPVGHDFVAISAGAYHNLAMKSDGSLVAWGRDSKGQVRGTPAGTNFFAIAAGGYHCLAIDLDCPYLLEGDFDDNCRVNMKDYQILSGVWLSTYHVSDLQIVAENWLVNCIDNSSDPACVPENCLYKLQGDFDDNCRVNLKDYQILSEAWLSTYYLSDLQAISANWLVNCIDNPFDPACVPE